MLRKDLIMDLGNGAVKIRNSRGELVQFKATTILGSTQYDLEGKHKISINEGDNNEISYIIGDEEGAYCATDRRYFTENYRALLLTGIGVALEGETADEFEVDLGLNLPLTLYKEGAMSKVLKTKYENQKFEFNLDGKDYKVTIKSVTVLPENLVVSLLKKEDVKYKNLFFDIGNGTVDILFTEGSKLGRLKTEYKGIDYLMDLMCGKSSARKNQIIKYWDNLNEITVKGTEKNLNKIKENTLVEYVLELIGIAEKENGGNLNDVNTIHLLGGGAFIVKETMETFVKNTTKVFDNPQFANLICLEKMYRAQKNK